MSYVNFDNEPLMFNDDFIIRESTLTLLTNGNGTLTADKLTGMPGDTVVLVPTNSSYYRFNSYSVTGGTIENNVFTFGYTDATACANFGANYFTVSGGFKESNSYVNSTGGTAYNPVTQYLVVRGISGDVPSGWFKRGGSSYSGWSPWQANDYSISLNLRARVDIDIYANIGLGGKNQYGGSAWVSGYFNNGLNNTDVESFSFSDYDQDITHISTSWYYSKDVTTTDQRVSVYAGDPYAMGIRLSANVVNYTAPGYYWTAAARINSAGNTGTWTATGIAP